MLELVKGSHEYQRQIIEMMDEWKAENEKIVPYAVRRHDWHDFDNYLKSLELEEDTDEFVADSTYFCYEKENDRMVGAVNIRHHLNERLLFNGGHVGDGIRPSLRGKGYGTKMLHLALQKCALLDIDKVLMVCDKDNPASAAVIVKNGGVMENELDDEGVIIQRYWIDLEKKAMQERHSVRQYEHKTIPGEIRKALDECADECNEEGNLHIQIFYDEPDCFNNAMAHYGKFKGAENYIVMAGKKQKNLAEKCGYYGERLVLKAQMLGLNTCWAALTHGKSKAKLADDEKEVIVIALGYGINQGNVHRSKPIKDISNLTDSSPEWFKKGVEAALLAPTAVNQQKFYLNEEKNGVSLKVGKMGVCLPIDKGIIRYHFEIGAGRDNFRWLNEMQ